MTLFFAAWMNIATTRFSSTVCGRNCVANQHMVNVFAVCFSVMHLPDAKPMRSARCRCDRFAHLRRKVFVNCCDQLVLRGVGAHVGLRANMRI